jgi:hypothetical protein
MVSAPPWGTHPDDAEHAANDAGSPRARPLHLGLAVAAGLACAGVLALALTVKQHNPVLDVAAAVVLLAVDVAAVAGLGYGFRWVTVRGLVWWGRLFSPVLLIASAWAVTLANSYGDAHHYADGTVTALAELLLDPPVVGVIAALIGIGITWVWSFTPAGRASTRHAGDLDASLPPSGWPAADAEPPFAFRVPHHEAWHQLVLPMSVIGFALLGLVSVLVGDPGPLLLLAFVVVLMSPFLVILIVQAYRRRLVVQADGLYVARTLRTRLIPWQELADIEIAPDPGSQNNQSRMWLLTPTRRIGTDVPKADAETLERWRQVILGARSRLDPTRSDHPQ